MSYVVLARKYRPNSLKDLVGQDVVKNTLDQIFKDETIPHAFILFGIRGVGKTTIARIIAKGLNCELSINVNPCGHCISCISVTEGRHLDVIELDAASKTGVDDMREIIESSRYKPVQGRFKVFIIDEVHMLSKSAFNALLKTLEEPPPHVKFIFATTELKKIPDTILSRCLKLELGRIEPKILENHLKLVLKNENEFATEEAIKVISRLSEGSLRDALSLLDQAIFLTKASKEKVIQEATVKKMIGSAEKDIVFKIIDSLHKGDTKALLSISSENTQRCIDPLMLIQDVLEIIYAISCFQNSHNYISDFYTQEESAMIQLLAQSLDVSFVLRTWNLLIEGYQEISKSPLPSKSLDMLFLRICFIKNLPSIEDLLEEPKHKKESDLTTFSDCMRELAEIEPIVAQKAKTFVKIISYSVGHIVMTLDSGSPSNFAKTLENALFKLTNTNWVIEVKESGGMEPLLKIEETIESCKQDRIMNSNVINDAKLHFPDCKISIIKD